MTTKHTPEPWVVSEKAQVRFDCAYLIRTADEKKHNYEYGATLAALSQRDALRIVACVNACRNLSNDELEQKGLVTSISARFLAAERSRDELLEALEEVHRIASGSNITHNMMVIRDHCADAIAKAKGGAA
ncbi:MAG: hypothetical protein ACRC48_00745 [Aeromonas veronii]